MSPRYEGKPKVVGGPAAADRGVQLFPGHQLVDEAVGGVGGDPLGGVDGGGVAEGSVAVLDQLRGNRHDITVRVFPGAGRGLLDVRPTAPATLVTWIERQVN
jgi:hypothetical protein